MKMVMRILLTIAAVARLFWSAAAAAAGEARPDDHRHEPLVDVQTACPGVIVELRYATERNLTGRLLYPLDARCLLRTSVAQRLNRAQAQLSGAGYRLKIWDAYRPPLIQQALWLASPNPDFVGNPARGGSLHSWGVAVDVTLVNQSGRELAMPTDFDDFSSAAAKEYRGANREVAANLRLLQEAMAAAGFLGMRDEWWHFVAEDYRRFGPVEPAASIEPLK